MSTNKPKPEKPEMIDCPRCDGSGRQSVGVSIAMQRAFDAGYPSTYECEGCGGTGKIRKGTKPYYAPDGPGR